MIRVKDNERSLKFYQDVMGMFTNIFLLREIVAESMSRNESPPYVGE
jgi:predicted enzyme related to lactoylglutathione lyase